MDLNEERRKQLSDLDNFIKKSTEQLNYVLDSIGWTREGLLETKDLVTCPLNSSHRMPEKSLKQHVEKCSLRQDGYNSDEEFLSASEFSSCPSVVIDHLTLNRVLNRPTSIADLEEIAPGCEASATDVAAPRLGTSSTSRTPWPPRTSERLLTDLTPAERSALHEHVLASTRKDGAGHALLAEEDLHLPFGEGSKHSRPKTKLELLAEQRDAKRRRINHKKVHTSRKTHTEVLREVIRNQMEYLGSQDTVKNLDA